ncbi:RND transporter [Janthinobacterium sp. BJB1]|uniref:efflux transporter outer membrane subunit n=1 Tax=Janthinobacterium sp. GW458P TaxID=1981504 RepID=UPI000A324E2F|nr:efflux transporter outer membrane subunit [Janthinobacterium sp. GW458P]MBE3023563.1 efflux transporter outer membrane subunit [Janthinobacterium sp. GW458P]PHV18758.1 RND transporter [Janthinobacterium sp. BJB303]PJC97381.1 RND transporter [Janthinobacterium sp. BJB1]
MTTIRCAVRRTLAAGIVLALGGCALQGPPATVAAKDPAQWQAPLPHNGNLPELAGWWQRQGDALLVELITDAQQASPTVAAARTRIVQARADRVASGATLAPKLDATGSVVRTSQQSLQPGGTTSQAALQASWEIDVFGANGATRDAAQERYDSARALWHEARVSVAAEVANQYYLLRACRQLQAVAEQDAVSRRDSARLTALSAGAGFQPPANAALARASAAEGASRAIEQRASCDVEVKALVALSAMPEDALRRKLDANPAVLPSPVAIAALPAQTLAQRPDVYSAEREVAAASFEVRGAQAQRYPRLSLTGSIGKGNIRSGGSSITASTWSIGPLAVSLPIFDGGTRRAQVDAATARYDEAVVKYRAGVRQAVREVEEALVNLGSTEARSEHAMTALEGYRVSFVATEERYKNGLASLIELEDARRTRLAAENTVVNLERERSAAWVALYRAAGGGWDNTAAIANNAP